MIDAGFSPQQLCPTNHFVMIDAAFANRAPPQLCVDGTRPAYEQR
jgi:hypothetical protein